MPSLKQRASRPPQGQDEVVLSRTICSACWAQLLAVAWAVVFQDTLASSCSLAPRWGSFVSQYRHGTAETGARDSRVECHIPTATSPSQWAGNPGQSAQAASHPPSERG